MARPELHETLTALVGAVPDDGSTTVVEVRLDVPMEVTVARRDAGLVVYAAPGHTRFVSGVLPVVHRTSLHMVALTGLEAAEGWAAAPEGWAS